MNGKMGVVLCAVVALACGGLESDASVEPSAQGIAVAISPLVASVTPGGSVAFDAEITGTANTNVLWSVEEGDAGGSVTTSGLYSAPAAEGSYHVLVASAADVTRTARATVTVAATPPPPPPPPPGETTLAGAGWTGSTSLVDFPKTGPVTSGGTIVDIDDGLDGRTPFQRLQDALALLASVDRVIIRNNSGAVVYATARLTRSTGWSTTKEVFAYGTQRIRVDLSSFPSNKPLYFDGTSRNEHWKGFEFFNMDTTSSSHRGWHGIVEMRPGASYIKIEDFLIHHNNPGAGAGMGVTGVAMYGAHHITVQDCVMWHNGDGVSENDSNAGDGILCEGDYSGGGPQTTSSYLVRNVIINAPDDGIDLFYSNNITVLDNAIIGPGRYSNGVWEGDGTGIKCGGGPTGTPIPGSSQTVIGNVVVGAAGAGIRGLGAEASHPETALHNTVYGSGARGSVNAAGLIFDSYAHVVRDNVTARNVRVNWSTNVDPYNGVYQNVISGPVTATNNSWQVTPPQTSAQPFVDAANGDLSLPAGSPLVNAGTGGATLGASTIALQLLKDNWTLR